MTTPRAVSIAALALILVSGQLHSAPQKGPKPDVGAGRVAWFDITTTNMTQSKEFYGRLFGWQFESLPGPYADLAAEIVSRGTSIGTLRKAEGAISPYDGVVYIQVDDIQASCKKAAELGGKVVPGFPFNLSNGGGAIGLVADPAGHPIGMYSRTPLPEAPAKK
ncbi:MAG TPA: VOC family protein [Thermoanaerobaculia bacterium]